jgi:hypothetical protein
MKLMSLWIDENQLRDLKALAKKKGSLKVSQLIRMAIAEFLAREGRKR